MKKWTEGERKTVAHYYGRKSAAEIGEIVGRTEQAIHKEASRQGLTAYAPVWRRSDRELMLDAEMRLWPASPGSLRFAL